MAQKKVHLSAPQKLLLQHLRSLQQRLAEINAKLDHLIQSCRKFYFTDDFSHSPHEEFKD